MSHFKTSKAMDEVHKWREEIYNETKNIPLDKKLDYFHNTSEKICAEFGLRRMLVEKVK